MNTKYLPYLLLLLIAGAFCDMPYGYYQFLRISIFIASLYYLLCGFETSIKFGWIIFAILYNPIIPLYFKRNNWEIINIATVVFILLWIYNTKKQTKKKLH